MPPKVNSSAHSTQSAWAVAQRLLNRKLAVVPCRPNSKVPCVGGFADKPLSRDELKRHLHDTDSNIALALHHTDLIDIECDTPAAEKKVQDWFDGDVPDTPTFKSSRGLHRLFKRPKGLPPISTVTLDGVECRIGSGNKATLSLIPPSIADGVQREWLPGLSIFDIEPAELPAETVKRLQSSGGKKRGGSQAQTAAEVLLGIASDAELWHTPDAVAFATLQCDDHREHWPIRSRQFKEWIGREFYRRTHGVPGSQTINDVLNVLEAKAKFEGTSQPVFVRVAGHDDGCIYIDLADDKWRAIRVSKSGWKIVDDPPVRFRRHRAMKPLPAPQRGGSVADLRRFINATDKQWPLVLGWLAAALRPVGPYAILELYGEQGSAKSTAARVLRAFIDPNTAPIRSSPRDERDLMIAASNGWVVNLDNLSHVTPDISDALCRLAMGNGFATRALYEDAEESIFVASRPIILNGIEEVGTRSDLLDRCVVVELPRIEPGNRRAEDVFWQEFDEARPGILGALLDAVSAAIRNLPNVQRSDTPWPRMADFAQWATAAEEALGLPVGAFLKAYNHNRKSANDVALESTPIVPALAALLKRSKGRFEGTATELLDALSMGQDTRPKGWPRSAKTLSGILQRLAPNLRADGYGIEKEHFGSGNAKRKGWTITAPAKQPRSSHKAR